MAALAERDRELAEARNETKEALERQNATAEVLKVIASSPSNAQPVFEAIAAGANHLLGGFSTTVIRFVGDTLRLVAFTPTNAPADAALQAAFPRPIAEFPPVSLVRDGDSQQFVDTEAESGVPPIIRELARLRGYRSMLFTPLMTSGAAIGMISVTRKDPGAFAADDIQLLQTFADQAVIAIQNARLFHEAQEALEQQKASADVLGAISKSVADTAPVFEAIIDACQRLFGGEEIGVYTIGDDQMVRAAAWRGPRAEEALRDVTPVGDSVTGRLIRERRTHHIPDLVAEPGISPAVRERAERLGSASLLYAPMLSEDRGLGSILVVRSPPKPFSAREQALLQSFADQAAIAIQNARLFNETKEALERQTATSEILRAIAGSPSDAQPVFESIVVAAAKRLRCDLAFVMLSDERVYMPVAGATLDGLLSDLGPSRVPIDWDANFPSRALLSKETYYLPDWSVVELPPHERGIHDLLGLSSAIYIPLLRDGEARGLLTLGRNRPSSFSATDIAQAEAFRDQAIIALENARLFNETKEALERQTATANVLKVISQSVSDAAPVFETILESCQRLFGLEAVAVYLVEGDKVKGVAQRGWDGGDWGRDAQPLEGSSTGRAIAERRAVHYPDLLADRPEIPEDKKIPLRERGGMSVLYAPMLSEDHGVGSIVVSRTPARPFSDKEISLVQSFADQAAIAIQNTRLFNETQEALEQQKASGDVLRAIAQSVADATPVFENILDASQRLFGTEEVCIFLVSEDGMVRPTAVRGPMFLAARNDVMPLEGSRTGRVIRERRVYHIPDGLADPDTPPAVLERMRRGGNVSIAFAPMLWEDSGLGSIAILRSPPRPFSERELELLRGFADQAVIAVQNARMFRETNEALAQQTATAEVLKVISRSAFDLRLATSTILEAAARLCRAPLATLHLRDGDVCRLDTQFGLPEAFEREARENPIPIRHPLHARRPARAGDVAHYSDAWTDPDYLYKASARTGGYRAIIVIPLMRKDELVGIFSLGRPEPGPFTETQIKLVQSFADQAAIAIENSRLFNEVKARTDDLTEALRFQTATSDVLKAISQSPNALKPVLDVIVQTSRNLCGAQESAVFMLDGQNYRLAADSGLEESFREFLHSNPIALDQRGSSTARAARERRTVHIPDISRDPEYGEGPMARGGPRALLSVPLMREGTAVGVITLLQPDVTPFSTRQIEVVETFADQAIIAIENARLFEEVQARTRDLGEALAQQTATADVLKVISRSAFDLQVVLDTLTASATKLCDGDKAAIFQRRGDLYHFVSNFGFSDEMETFARANPLPVGSSGGITRAGRDRRSIHIPDVLADPEYTQSGYQIRGDYRTLLSTPLMRAGEPIGGFVITRKAVRPFNDRQIELLQTFADQAVIAIENVRLFDEVQARTHDLTVALQQQTATAEVLQTISRSVFDLDTVLRTLIDTAVRLCRGSRGTIFIRNGDRIEGRAFHSNVPPGLRDYILANPAPIDRNEAMATAIREGRVIHYPDLASDPTLVPAGAREQAAFGALLCVPLMRDGEAIGCFAVPRDQPAAFSVGEIKLVETFADQAVIAIENARLFEQVQARTRELTQSLDDLRKAQDRLIQSEKLASLGQLTAGIAHEIKNPLNFINNFSALSRELMDELRELLEKAPLDGADREEAGDLIGMIDANLDKVVSHGKRADSIVKNMLLHSREGSGERGSVNVNAMVEEALNLAYHGARAERPGFNVTIAKSLDPRAGAADLYPQEVTRVLLNLISNGFYATTKRKQGEGNNAFEPTITASTRDLGHNVEISIRDNGTGIPDEVKAKMFNPFFTTKPAGEGTGLGLSLSHDIVVKQHGGTIEVTTEPGAFTQFTLVLPRAGATA